VKEKYPRGHNIKMGRNGGEAMERQTQVERL
jgi:hypothetical protein